MLWLHREVLCHMPMIPIPLLFSHLRRCPPRLNPALLYSCGYFEQWLNALVYELFFPEPLHAAGLHFFRIAEKASLRPLSEIKNKEIERTPR